MKKQTKFKLIVMLSLVLLLTGCTTTLKDENKKAVKNPETGQSLTKNILCKPNKEAIVDLYEENGVDIAALPKCSSFNITSGGYEGIWTSIFVKPLAFLILTVFNYVKSAGLALILVSISLRLVLYPITKKTALQSELIKKAQPELNKLEKKYEGKSDTDSMMKKSQEMTMIYKKYNINPLSGCLFSMIQIPLLIAFYEAINRVPTLFEDKFLGIQMGTTPSMGIFKYGNLVYFLLIVLVGATTYLSFSLNKSSQQSEHDPMKSMSVIMTGMITITGLYLSSALCIYWVTTNLFTICQNLIVKRSKEVNG